MTKYFIAVVPMCFFLLSCNSEIKIETEFTTLLETTKSWDGAALPEYPDGQPNVTILKVTIPPQSILNFHKHTVINAAVVLDGELTVVSESMDSLKVKAGDAFAELVNTWHFGENKSDKPVSLVVFYAGIEGGTNTILRVTEH